MSTAKVISLAQARVPDHPIVGGVGIQIDYGQRFLPPLTSFLPPFDKEFTHLYQTVLGLPAIVRNQESILSVIRNGQMRFASALNFYYAPQILDFCQEVDTRFSEINQTLVLDFLSEKKENNIICLLLIP